jgi:ribosomal protein S18 acetylase RimI-like enzyme
VSGPFTGLSLVRREDDDPTLAGIYAMWVAPEARGNGAAAALCDACLGWARERGCATIKVEVFSANAGARRVYERAGFQTVREEPEVPTPDGRVFPMVWMRRAVG